jgi:protein-tyrosine phosphatase
MSWQFAVGQPRKPSPELTAAALAALVVAVACASPGLPPEAKPPRHIELGHTLNTRDLGGYRTEDGRQVRWGLLFRSDALHDLDREDLEVLEELGLRTVFDLRSATEREGAEDRLPPQTSQVLLPISYPSMDPDAIASRILRGDASEGYFNDLLQRANRSFVLDQGEQLAAILNDLAEPGVLPALFHCTHGKDRTGFVSAFILSLLGVPWDTVVQDYLLSNVYLRSNTDRMARFIWFGSLFRISRANARDLLGVQTEYLESARSAVLEEYGSIADYARAAGVRDETLDRLRATLLEPVASVAAVAQEAP